MERKQMSRFDSPYQAQYVDRMRRFLRQPKQNFLRQAGFVAAPSEKRVGKLPAYPTEAVEALEAQVNRKAARAEAPDTTLPERLRLARDYAGLSDAAVARAVGVSRECVRQWLAGIIVPPAERVEALAHFFDVPLPWLVEGGEQHLPASSHVGVRVGRESLDYREALYAATVTVLAGTAEDANVDAVRAELEARVATDPTLSRLARRAGGRWGLISRLVFAAWEPVEMPRRRPIWPDATEAIIAEELAQQRSVYGAWKTIRDRCEAARLPYPAKISLHKRMAAARKRDRRWGVRIDREESND